RGGEAPAHTLAAWAVRQFPQREPVLADIIQDTLHGGIIARGSTRRIGGIHVRLLSTLDPPLRRVGAGEWTSDAGSARHRAPCQARSARTSRADARAPWAPRRRPGDRAAGEAVQSADRAARSSVASGRGSGEADPRAPRAPGRRAGALTQRRSA